MLELSNNHAGPEIGRNIKGRLTVESEPLKDHGLPDLYRKGITDKVLSIQQPLGKINIRMSSKNLRVI